MTTTESDATLPINGRGNNGPRVSGAASPLWRSLHQVTVDHNVRQTVRHISTPRESKGSGHVVQKDTNGHAARYSHAEAACEHTKGHTAQAQDDTCARSK